MHVNVNICEIANGLSYQSNRYIIYFFYEFVCITKSGDVNFQFQRFYLFLTSNKMETIESPQSIIMHRRLHGKLFVLDNIASVTFLFTQCAMTWPTRFAAGAKGEENSFETYFNYLLICVFFLFRNFLYSIKDLFCFIVDTID